MEVKIIVAVIVFRGLFLRCWGVQGSPIPPSFIDTQKVQKNIRYSAK